MAKKFLAMLLSVAMLATLVTVPAFSAAADGYWMTFSGESADVSQWVSLSDGSLVSGSGAWVSGVGGREQGDQSLKLTNTGYFMNKFTMKDNVVIEFDVMFPGPANTVSEYKQFRFTLKGAAINNDFLHKSGAYSKNRWDAKVVNNDNWNHFVYAFDCAAGTYDLYVNGNLLRENSAINITNGADTEFRFLSVNADDEYPIYLDDVKYYSGTYDNSNAAATLVSTSGVKVNEEEKRVEIGEIDVADAVTKLTASEGAIVIGVMDKDTMMTKTSGIVENGDYIVVCAPDLTTYTYYTVGVKKTDSYSQDFTGKDIPDLTGWPQTGSGEYLCAGGTRTGVGGKDLSDVSALINNNGSYLRKDVTLYGKSTIEFNTLVTESNWGYIGKNTGNTSLAFFQGSNKLNHTNRTYETGKWYHLAYVIDAANQTYDLYFNGVKEVDGGRTSTLIQEGVVLDLRFYGDLRYYDDLKIYSGEFVPGTTDVTVVSAGDVVVDNEEKTISIKAGTVANYIAGLGASDGAVITGVCDPATFLTKATTDSVAEGDLVTILAPDGKTYNYYTVVGAASIVSAGSYTVDESAKTISGVYNNTSVEYFKDVIVCADETAVKVVKKDGVEVTEGEIENGMTLTIGASVYTIALSSMFVNDTFTGLEGTKVSDYVNGNGQANAAGITANRNGFSNNAETGTEAYYEIVKEDGNEMMRLYVSNTSDHPFFGKNLGTGTTSNNVVEFSINKTDRNTASKLIFYGPKESTKDQSSNWNLVCATPVAFETDGAVYFDGEVVCGYELGKWYRVVVVTDIPGNKMTLYINGLKAGEKTFEDPIFKIYDIRFQQQKTAKSSEVFYDDLKWYECDPQAEFYADCKVTELTSDDAAVVVNSGAVAGTISADVATVGELLAKIDAHGAVSAYSKDGTPITDDNTALATGIYLAVTSCDGLATAKYTYVEEFVSEIKFNTVETTTFNGDVTASVRIATADYTTPITATLIIAKYEGGKLTETHMTPISTKVSKGNYIDRDYTATVTVTDNTKESVKAFLWTSVDGLKPVKVSKELKSVQANF